jgi:hypothetical protein
MKINCEIEFVISQSRNLQSANILTIQQSNNLAMLLTYLSFQLSSKYPATFVCPPVVSTA